MSGEDTGQEGGIPAPGKESGGKSTRSDKKSTDSTG